MALCTGLRSGTAVNQCDGSATGPASSEFIQMEQRVTTMKNQVQSIADEFEAVADVVTTSDLQKSNW